MVGRDSWELKAFKTAWFRHYIQIYGHTFSIMSILPETPWEVKGEIKKYFVLKKVDSKRMLLRRLKPYYPTFSLRVKTSPITVHP
jgi:hypothetical protein